MEHRGPVLAVLRYQHLRSRGHRATIVPGSCARRPNAAKIANHKVVRSHRRSVQYNHSRATMLLSMVYLSTDQTALYQW
jgi:hypothetical protein